MIATNSLKAQLLRTSLDFKEPNIDYTMQERTVLRMQGVLCTLAPSSTERPKTKRLFNFISAQSIHQTVV